LSSPNQFPEQLVDIRRIALSSSSVQLRSWLPQTITVLVTGEIDQTLWPARWPRPYFSPDGVSSFELGSEHLEEVKSFRLDRRNPNAIRISYRVHLPGEQYWR
jgi:hypothetical protein